MNEETKQLEDRIAALIALLNEKEALLNAKDAEIAFLRLQASSPPFFSPFASLMPGFPIPSASQMPGLLFPALPMMPLTVRKLEQPGKLTNSSYSSETSIDIKRRPNFIRSILQLPSKGLETAFTLEPLKGQINREDSEEYFSQFLPYILEEVRASICAQTNTIAKKNRQPFPIYPHSTTSNTEACDTTESDTSEIDENEKVLTFWTYERNLPKLDHGFYNEAVLIVMKEREGQTLPRKSEPFKSSREDTQSQKALKGILAIATRLPFYKDDDDEENRKVKLKIVLPQKDYTNKQNSSLFSNSEGELLLHWLCGLTPAEPMFEVCFSMPRVEFQHHFIQAALPEWPDLPSEKQEQPLFSELAGLNDIQRNVIERLQNVSSGLWLVQGPPGTGKTTTAIKFLVDYAKKNPNHRILVTAPSNQAVRVLLTETSRFLPPNSLALTGIAKNIPDQLQEVYVHNYASYLSKPLMDLKKQLKNEKNRKKRAQLLDRLNEYLISLEEKLRTLLDEETPMHIKSNVRRGMRRFLIKLAEGIVTFRQLHQQLPSTAPTTSNWSRGEKVEDSNKMIDELDEIITLIQENSFYLESFRLQRSQIVFATLISAGRPSFRKQIDSFSMVLVDEAAQALVPETLIPLYFKPSLYIQFGDPNQLPATVTSQAARKEGYENSMMHWLINEYSQPHQMLTMQYRMDEDICHWISQQYYNNRLITAPELIERTSVLQKQGSLPTFLQNSTLFFDINGEENRRGGSGLTSSCFNVIEAKRVIDMAYYLIMCGFHPTQIGIITFYSEQVNVLNEYLGKVIHKSKVHGLEIKSVDGFQGGEKDIILISTVRTSESVGFLNDQRRLNVAMSRSKYGRWIFGKYDSLIRSNSDFPSLLSEHSERAMIINENRLNAYIPPNDYSPRRLFN